MKFQFESNYCVRAEGTLSLEWTGSGSGFTIPGKGPGLLLWYLDSALSCQHENANGVASSTLHLGEHHAQMDYLDYRCSIVFKQSSASSKQVHVSIT